MKKMPDEKEILKELVVTEKDIIKNLIELVKRSKNIFVIEENSGKIIFKNFKNLKNHQKICALLIGKYFATKLDFIEKNSLNLNEISSELKIKETTLSAPLKKLSDEGFILKDEKEYSVNHHRIEEILDAYFKE